MAVRSSLILGIIVVVEVAATSVSAADCPANVRQLPLTGLLSRPIASPTTQKPDQRPALHAELGVAGTMRTDASSVHGSVGAAGEVRAHRYGLSGCASGDLIDAREGAVHLTASGQAPLGFTGIALGVTVDRDVRLPLSSRAELFRDPVSRLAVQTSLAMIDFDLGRFGSNQLRILFAPTSAEVGVATQDATTPLDRRTTRLEVALLRLITDHSTQTRELSLLGIDIERNESRIATAPTMPVDPEPTGFVRYSPLAYAHRRSLDWSYELDAGVLSLEGPIDCKQRRCNRGFYTGALGHGWQHVSVEARAERTGFLDALAVPTLEDRLSVTTSVERGSFRGSTSVFVARTESIAGDASTRWGGTRLQLTQALGHDVSARFDGELVRSDATHARMLLSLAWQRATTRYDQRASSAR